MVRERGHKERCVREEVERDRVMKRGGQQEIRQNVRGKEEKEERTGKGTLCLSQQWHIRSLCVFEILFL